MVTLFDVWGSSATDVWAVGAEGTILHWDGAAWRDSPSGTTADLFGVWALSPTQAWAVGEGGTLLVWDGAAWSPVATGSTQTLRAVHGKSATQLWIGGDCGTVLRWSGTAWVAMPKPPSAAGSCGASVRTLESSPKGLFVGGEGGPLARWDGKKWVPLPAAGGVDALGWAGAKLYLLDPDGVLSSGDGLKFTRGPSLGAPVSPRPEEHGDLWVAPDGAVWVAPTSGGLARFHLRVSTTYELGGRVQGVWGTGPTDLWAVGDGGAIFHWDGQQWILLEGHPSL